MIYNPYSKYQASATKLDELSKAYTEPLNKLKALKKQRFDLSKEITAIDEKIKVIETQKESSAPQVKNLEDQVDNIYQHVKTLRQDKQKIEYDYKDKLNKFYDYQKLVDYIKEATKKKDQLKKAAEKKKKMEEKRAKKQGEAASEEKTTTAAVAKPEAYGYEIQTCEWLITFFKGVIGVNDTVTKEDEKKPQVQTHSKVNEDIKKGNLQEIKHDEDDDVIGLGSNKKVAKNKGGKQNKLGKKAEKQLTTSVLCLDPSVNTQIKDVGLKPPSFKHEVDAFIKEINSKLEQFRLKRQENAAAAEVQAATPTVTVDAPNTANTEEKKEQNSPKPKEKNSPKKNSPKKGGHDEDFEDQPDEGVEDPGMF